MKERTRLGLGTLEAALLLGLLGDALLRASPWGLNFLLWAGALVASALALARRRGGGLTAEARWLLPSVLLLAAAFAWRDSPVLRAVDLQLMLLLLALASFASRGGAARTAGLTEYALAGFVAAADALTGALLLLIRDIGWQEIPRARWTRHAASAARGLALALPVVFVFGLLFMAADAVFENYVNRALDLDIEVAFQHAFVALGCAWLAGGYLRGMFLGPAQTFARPGDWLSGALGFETAADRERARSLAVRHAERSTASAKNDAAREQSAAKKDAPPCAADDEDAAFRLPPPSVTADAAQETTEGERDVAAGGAGGVAPGLSLGATEVGVVLGLLNLLFLAFVVVQARYFFGGASVVESSGGLMTYSEYARRGFFELVWAAALLLPLLLAAHWLLRKERAADERAFRVLAAGLIALMFVIMVSAAGRMRLYQSEYGLTELRLYTSAFMGWLALVFVWFALTVLRGRRERFMRGALAAGLLVTGALHVVNPDDLIVRTNASTVRQARTFDACYAASLSADAVPALLDALPALTERERRHVSEALLRRWSGGDADWRTWNLSRSAARHAVGLRREALRAAQTSEPAQVCGPFGD